MISLLRTYEENGEKVEEYTRDGQVVSHIVRKQIIDKSELQADEKITPAPTIEDRLEAIEQTSAYTQIQVEYLATLAEINNGL